MLKRTPGRKRDLAPIEECMNLIHELESQGRPPNEIVKEVAERTKRCRQQINNYYGAYLVLKEEQ